LLNTLIYKATCFSSTEPSSGLYRRTDPYQIFCTIGITKVYNAKVLLRAVYG